MIKVRKNDTEFSFPDKNPDPLSLQVKQEVLVLTPSGFLQEVVHSVAIDISKEQALQLARDLINSFPPE